jgi:hypothetical protein
VSNIVRECLARYIEEHVGSPASQQAFSKFVTDMPANAISRELEAQARLNKKIEDTPTDE